MANPKGVPEGYHSITPTLICKNCSAAIDFYKKALGAQELFRMNSPDGKVAHAELQIGDSIFFVGDEFDMPGCGRSPQTLGGYTGSFYIYVPDVDASFNQAVIAGGKVNMPVQDMFWGDRYGSIQDPFGHVWGIGTQKEKLTPQQVEERAKEFYAKMAQQKGAA
ncbi:MAG: VOC family protein [Terriglobales bacterium]